MKYWGLNLNAGTLGKIQGMRLRLHRILCTIFALQWSFRRFLLMVFSYCCRLAPRALKCRPIGESCWGEDSDYEAECLTPTLRALEPFQGSRLFTTNMHRKRKVYRFLRAITPESIVAPVREIAWKYI